MSSFAPMPATQYFSPTVEPERPHAEALLDDSPDPVLCLSARGRVVYANLAGQTWLKLLGIAAPYRIPSSWLEISRQVLQSRRAIDLELQHNRQVYQCVFVPSRTAGCVNLYGRDITRFRPLANALAGPDPLEAQITRQNNRLLSVHSAGASFNTSLYPYQVLNTVTRQMVAVLNLQSCVIFEWDADANTLTMLAGFSLENGDHRAAVEPGLPLAPTSAAVKVLTGRQVGQFPAAHLEAALLPALDLPPAKIGAVLLLPLVFQDQTLGLVLLTTAHRHTFTPQEISMAQLLTNQAAGAIENARLYDEVHQRVDELTVLNTVSQVITSTLDLQEMLAIITDLTTSLLHVEATSVALYYEADGCLKYAAASGAGAKAVTGKRLAPGQGITGWVFEHGEPAMALDVSTDARFYAAFDRESSFVTRSILCVPLQAKGQVIGTVAAINKQNGLFDAQDLRLLSSLAAPAAIAIENARLFEQTQREIAERKRAETDRELTEKFSRIYAQHLEALEILHDVGLRLMNNLDTSSVLELTARAVLDVIPEAAGCDMHFTLQAHRHLLPEVFHYSPNGSANGTGPALAALARQVINTGAMVDIPHPGASALFPPVPGVQAVLAMPLIDHQLEQVLGALSVFSPKANVFTESHQYILSILVNQAAVAIQKACFFEEREQAQTREKQAIRDLFQRYVNPTVVERLVKGRDHLALGGIRQQVSVMFADLRGFTAFSEHQPPEALVEILNQYFALAVEAILAQEGTLDKFMGDAIMAFFNAPLPQANHTLRAAQAALAMQRTIIEHNLIKAVHRPLNFGIGLHTGPAVVGNIGTAQQMNYTAIGDTVNLAKRLQENAQEGQILLSQAAYEALKDVAVVRDLGPLTVKGRTAAEHVYVLIDLKG